MVLLVGGERERSSADGSADNTASNVDCSKSDTDGVHWQRLARLMVRLHRRPNIGGCAKSMRVGHHDGRKPAAVLKRRVIPVRSIPSRDVWRTAFRFGLMMMMMMMMAGGEE